MEIKFVVSFVRPRTVLERDESFFFAFSLGGGRRRRGKDVDADELQQQLLPGRLRPHRVRQLLHRRSRQRKVRQAEPVGHRRTGRLRQAEVGDFHFLQNSLYIFFHCRPLSYSNVDLFLVCFSLDSPSSLRNVSTKWLPDLKRHARKVPTILVGLKQDLRDGGPGKGQKKGK